MPDLSPFPTLISFNLNSSHWSIINLCLEVARSSSSSLAPHILMRSVFIGHLVTGHTGSWDTITLLDWTLSHHYCRCLMLYHLTQCTLFQHALDFLQHQDATLSSSCQKLLQFTAVIDLNFTRNTSLQVFNIAWIISVASHSQIR